MIEAAHISKTYPNGVQALRDLNVKIKPGEFVAIIGRSGSGKTTFLKLINKTIVPTEGKLTVLNEDVGALDFLKLKALRRKIGFIFQQFNLVKSLSVLQNVLTGRLGYHSDLSGALGIFTPEEVKMAQGYLQDVGLQDKAGHRVDELSGGQQQRVAIARALVQDPQIILADEPMASLDPKSSEVVLGLLKRFNQEKKITVIVNIHVLELAKRYADRILAFKKGELVYDGPAQDLDSKTLASVYE